MEEEKNTVKDPQNVLCRISDVNHAIQTSFQRFVNEEKKSLEDLADCLKDELSKMELFVPQSSLEEG